MKINYNGVTIAKADKRFKEIRWQDVDFKDSRIKRHKKVRKIDRGLRNRVIALLIVLGFLALQIKDHRPKSQVSVESSPGGIVESAMAKETKEPAQVAQGDLFQVYFGDKANIMRAICKAESGLDTNAVGDTNTKYPSVGLCQIRLLPERQITMEQMKNPEENVKYAKLLYDKHGFTPWTMYKNGNYLNYID